MADIHQILTQTAQTIGTAYIDGKPVSADYKFSQMWLEYLRLLLNFEFLTFLFCVIFISLFRKNISSLIDRIKEVIWGNKKFSWDKRKQIKAGEIENEEETRDSKKNKKLPKATKGKAGE